MTSAKPPDASPVHGTRPPIVWSAVFGLGALVLLWPLTGLTGIGDAIGAIPRAIGVVTIIGAAWVGVVGVGMLPRPILTLILTGMAGGLYIAVADLSAAVAAGGQAMSAVPFALVDLIGGGAIWGVLAGLIAAGIQRVRGRNR